MRRKAQRRRNTHPLAAFVLEQFNTQSHHDGPTIAMALGCVPPQDYKAYRQVARVVLEVLREQGHLIQDHAGWYVRANPDTP
jgi:hypothetical protein